MTPWSWRQRWSTLQNAFGSLRGTHLLTSDWRRWVRDSSSSSRSSNIEGDGLAQGDELSDAIAEKLEKLLEMMYFRLDEGGASLRANGRVTMEAADTKKFLKVMSQAAIKMETRRLERLQYEREALEAGREGDDDDTSWVAAPHPDDPSRTFFYHRGTHETRWEPPRRTTATPRVK